MNKDIITLVSTNEGKRKSLERALKGLNYEIQLASLDIMEPQLDKIEEIALFKANEAFKTLKRPLVVNDGGVVIPELNGFPGPYTKYVTKVLTTQNILSLIKDCTNRECYLTQCLVYVDKNGFFHKFQDKVFGQIAVKASNVVNSRAWGSLWNIFVPKSSTKPLAELSEEEYHLVIRPQAQTNSVWQDFKDFLIKQTPTD